MNALRKTSIATVVIVLLAYLLVCGLFALRPLGAGGMESGTMTFALDRPMEEALAEGADYLKRECGPDITVTVNGTTLSFAFSFSSPYGYDDVTGTMTLSEDKRYGEGSCKVTYNVVVKERTAPVLLAPAHYLLHSNKKAHIGSIMRDLISKLTTSFNKEDTHDGQ